MIHRLIEGFESTTPDLKYYAFDWDNNIVDMPTKIILKDKSGNEVEMSTEDYANYRHDIGVKPFKYNGKTIVGYSDSPFRNFRVEGDSNFIRDSMKATPGPAFNDFKEAINNGSIFAIITARGHRPETIKKAIYNYIINGFNGIDKNQLIKNLKKYRTFVGEDDMRDNELIIDYLNLCKYYPVSYNVVEGAISPEQLKVEAMEEFVEYVRRMSEILQKRFYFKNDISNSFIPSTPTVGFSDDDLKNVEVMRDYFSKKDDNIVRTYLTNKGVKKEFK